MSLLLFLRAHPAHRTNSTNTLPYIGLPAFLLARPQIFLWRFRLIVKTLLRLRLRVPRQTLTSHTFAPPMPCSSFSELCLPRLQVLCAQPLPPYFLCHICHSGRLSTNLCLLFLIPQPQRLRLRLQWPAHIFVMPGAILPPPGLNLRFARLNWGRHSKNARAPS